MLAAGELAEVIVGQPGGTVDGRCFGSHADSPEIRLEKSGAAAVCDWAAP
jgi:hypothetical protein